jgi:hypothetical protein
MKATIVERYSWSHANPVGMTIAGDDGVNLPGLIVIEPDRLDTSVKSEIARYTTGYTYAGAKQADGTTELFYGSWSPGIDVVALEAAIRYELSSGGSGVATTLP